MPLDVMVALVKYLFLAQGGTLQEWHEEG